MEGRGSRMEAGDSTTARLHAHTPAVRQTTNHSAVKPRRPLGRWMENTATLYQFDDFVLDTEKHELRRGSRPINIPAQPLKALRYLIEHRGEVVSRRELREHLWGNLHVEHETGINFCMNRVRRALGDRATASLYIQTIRGQGYRFVGRLTEPHDST